MMYLKADLDKGEKSTLNVANSAVGQINAVNQVDPEAEFVLVGHSRGANGVLALTHAMNTNPQNLGVTPTFKTEQIKGIGAFDPSIPNSAEQAQDPNWTSSYNFYPGGNTPSVANISQFGQHTTIVTSGDPTNETIERFNLPPELTTNGPNRQVVGVNEENIFGDNKHLGLVNNITDNEKAEAIANSLLTPPSTPRSTSAQTPSPTATSTPAPSSAAVTPTSTPSPTTTPTATSTPTPQKGILQQIQDTIQNTWDYLKSYLP